MASAILVILFLVLMFRYLKEQKAQERRIAMQRDLPREELLPHHYQSFVELENKLWAATEESARTKWETGRIRLRAPEAELVRDYVEGLRKDFRQANRIFSVVIGRSPSAEVLIQMERYRLKIELPYHALCALARLRLWTNRVSMKELRSLNDFVSTMAYEVRYILAILEGEGRIESVDALLRRS